MKARFVLTSVTCGVILFMRVSSGAVITFDDLLHNTGSTSDISSHYQGLVWSNVSVMNSILYTNVLGVTGYYYGLASPSNVAVLFGSNQFSPNSEIDSPATNINFLSAYLTGAGLVSLASTAVKSVTSVAQI